MRLHSLLLIALVARLATAQGRDTTHPAGATVSGVVSDSIARLPLAGATVQLVDADSLARFGRTALSDSLGRFTFADVPDGHYTLGFFHPMLDSLGVAPPLREVYVAGHQAVRADLGIPSPARLRAAICGSQSASDSGGALVVGVVRDARDHAPAAGVTVSGEWVELSFTPEGVVRHVPRRVATTGENGWFALCNVPSAGTMTLTANRGADSTDLIEVEVPAGRFVRRELYLGTARTVVVGDTTPRVDSLSPPPRRVHTGDGRLNGTVVAVADGQPVAGAQVNVSNGLRTRANERGEWTLMDAPFGTRMLEIRAVGYYPERRAVDVVAGVAPVRVALFTLKAMLDTVKIKATRLRTAVNPTGFEQRRRTGAGRYLTPRDIARRSAFFTSSIFRMVPGIRLERPALGPATIEMRGAFQGWCEPAIYIDGHHMWELSADEIDGLVTPAEITGIEIYSEVSIPPQFQLGLNGCGAIVIWTR